MENNIGPNRLGSGARATTTKKKKGLATSGMGVLIHTALTSGLSL